MATSADPEWKSPYDVWHGELAPLKVMPCLKPGFCKSRRVNKMNSVGRECFYLGQIVPKMFRACSLNSATLLRHGMQLNTKLPPNRSNCPSHPQKHRPANQSGTEGNATTVRVGFHPSPADSARNNIPPTSSPATLYLETITSTATMTMTRQLGGHKRGLSNGDEVREGRIHGQTRKIREGLLRTF